jgi:hypothetical protein
MMGLLLRAHFTNIFSGNMTLVRTHLFLQISPIQRPRFISLWLNYEKPRGFRSLAGSLSYITGCRRRDFEAYISDWCSFHFGDV